MVHSIILAQLPATVGRVIKKAGSASCVAGARAILMHAQQQRVAVTVQQALYQILGIPEVAPFRHSDCRERDQ